MNALQAIHREECQANARALIVAGAQSLVALALSWLILFI